jgi:hypothetical protein
MQKIEQNTWNGEKKYKMTKEDKKTREKAREICTKIQKHKRKSVREGLVRWQERKRCRFKPVGYLSGCPTYPSGQPLPNQHSAE